MCLAHTPSAALLWLFDSVTLVGIAGNPEVKLFYSCSGLGLKQLTPSKWLLIKHLKHGVCCIGILLQLCAEEVTFWVKLHSDFAVYSSYGLFLGLALVDCFSLELLNLWAYLLSLLVDLIPFRSFGWLVGQSVSQLQPQLPHAEGKQNAEQVHSWLVAAARVWSAWAWSLPGTKTYYKLSNTLV